MLRSAPEGELLAWLSASCAWLRAHYESCVDASRLSREGFALAVQEALPSDAELEAALHALRSARPVGEVALILPNNVETAIVRPLFWSLLGRNNTRVKLPSLGSGFAELVLAALRETQPELAASVTSSRFDRHDDASLVELVSGADAVHVFGRDETVRAVARRVAEERLLPHGSGLGLVILPNGGVTAAAASRIALDMARHDQRGCLSPHAVIIEEGSEAEAFAWAEQLHHALTRLDREVPRGLVSPSEAGAERAWRDVASATGDVFATATHAVSVEAAVPPRDCPGLRNIAVHAMTASALERLVRSLGSHLKCVGALDFEHAESLRVRFVDASDVVPVGSMQTPRFAAPMDGRPPHTGFALF